MIFFENYVFIAYVKQYLIVGVTDAITAYKYSNNPRIDYLWASSFVMSAMLGLKDDGMVNIKDYLPLIMAIVKASRCPIILDFDVGGKDTTQYQNNLHLLKKLKIGGICIEDEQWPKMNAMLKHSKRKLISPDLMVEKIRTAKIILGYHAMVIARTHSLLINESLGILQKRIDGYQAAGADALCIHYTGDAWQNYQKIISKLRIIKPLLLILSRRNTIPQPLSKSRFQFILYPNQLYRTMLYPVIRPRHHTTKKQYDFVGRRMIRVNELFSIINKINDKDSTH